MDLNNPYLNGISQQEQVNYLNALQNFSQGPGILNPYGTGDLENLPSGSGTQILSMAQQQQQAQQLAQQQVQTVQQAQQAQTMQSQLQPPASTHAQPGSNHVSAAQLLSQTAVSQPNTVHNMNSETLHSFNSGNNTEITTSVNPGLENNQNHQQSHPRSVVSELKNDLDLDVTTENTIEMTHGFNDGMENKNYVPY